MLNPQQNKKLLQKLSHCLEVFEPYLFEPQGKLDYRMFETREHLRAVRPTNASTRRSPIGAVRGRPAGSKAGISPPNSSQGGRSI